MAQIDLTATDPLALPECPVKLEPEPNQTASAASRIAPHDETDTRPDIVTLEGFVHFTKEQHLRLIYYFLRKHLMLEDAQDLAQETFLVLWKKRDRSQPPHIRYLFGIARRVYYAFLKRRSITEADLIHLSNALDQGNGIEVGNICEPDEVPVQPGISVDMILQSASLSQKQRKVLDLIYVEGLSMQEAGEQLGIARGSVQLHARRAVAELRRIWFSSKPKRI